MRRQATDGFHPPDLSDPGDARLFDEGQEALDQYLGWRSVGLRSVDPQRRWWSA